MLKDNTRKALLNISEAMTSAGDFIKLRTLLEEFDSAEDKDSKEIINIMLRFSKLIDIAKRDIK